MKRATVLLIIFCIYLNQNIFSQIIKPTNNDKKVVIVPAGQSRTFMFTNDKGLFYYGETGQQNTSQYQGLSYLTHKFLEDYIIESSGEVLSRAEAEVQLMGDRVIRRFKNLSIEEEISMSDSLPILMVKLRSKQKAHIAITPLISGSDDKQDFTLDWSASDKILYISRIQKLVQNNHNDIPDWLGIYTYPEGEYSTSAIEYDSKKSTAAQRNTFYPGKINIYFEIEALVLFVIGNNKNEVINNRNIMLNDLNLEIKKQNTQIEGIRQTQINIDFDLFALFLPSY